MEIGGCDFVVKTTNPKKMMQIILDSLYWEDPIFEDDGVHGIFVYPDLESKNKWDEDSSEREAPMIYFIFGEDFLSITSDELIINKIRSVI
jgi:hypothetical protein